MLRFALLLTLAAAACYTDPGDDTGSAAGTSSTTAPGTTSTSTTGTTTSTTDPTTGGPTTSTTDPTTGGPDTTGEPASTGDATTDMTTGGDPACMNYCTELMGACSGANLQYSSLESCLGVCGTFSEGMVGDVTGNTLACRLYHTGAAAEDADTHCVHAGPGGANACGTNCESFCAVATNICPTEHPSNDACLTLCATFADEEKYDSGDTNGNTLACRLYHLTVAAVDDQNAQVHCPHTLAASPPCM
jgi:hypothetical protein